MYEIGKVYIWQNCTGLYAHLNGTETTVTGAPSSGFDVVTNTPTHWGQETDTPAFFPGASFIWAERGDLRPKNPPPGEQLINEMFYVNVTA